MSRIGRHVFVAETLEARVLLSTYPGIADDLLTAGGYQIPDGHNGICTTIDQLCQIYAPVMKLNAGGNAPGNDLERYHPKPVDLITAARPAGEAGNWPVLYRPVDSNGLVWQSIATITDVAQLGAYGAGYGDCFIDLPGNSIYSINAFYDKIKDSAPDTVYTTVFEDPILHRLVLKYHFYYYGNDFWDEHESDWEAVTLLFDQSGPYLAHYNQHNWSEERAWDGVEIFGQTHPVVYVGEGGHASYFGPGHTQVNYVATEFHYGDGEILYPAPAWSNGYVVQVLPNDRTANLSNINGKNLSWLKYEGSWGQPDLPSILPVGNDGPGGPFAGSRWDPANVLSGWGDMPARAGTDLVGRSIEVNDYARTDPLGLDPALHLDFSVLNQGDQCAEGFLVRFYLSDDAVITTSDSLLGTAIIDSLAAGNHAAGTISLELPETDPFRSDNGYYVGMLVNATGLIPESDETNNSGRGLGQDLLKASSDGDLGSPADGTTKYWGGGSIRYSSTTVQAIGDEWIGARDVDVYPVDGAAGATVGFDVDSYTEGFDTYLRLYNSSWALVKSNDSGTAPDETSSGTDPYLWYTFPDGGVYYLVVSSAENHTADPRYLTGRSAGSTGTYKLTKLPGQMPELRGTVLTAGPTPVGADGQATIHYTVTNAGGAPAGAFGVDFYLVDQGLPGPTQAAFRHVDVAGLEPGASASGTFTLDLSGLAYGTTMLDNSQFVRMYVDRAGAVLESDETNNSGRGEGLDVATITFEAHETWSCPISATQTIVAGIGDELIGSRDIDVYKFAALPGASTTVAVARTGGALNSTIRVYDSSWNLVASDLASHANASAAFTSAYGGDYYLVVADYANKDKMPTVFTGRAAGAAGTYTINVTGQKPDLVPLQFTVWDAVADGSGAVTVTTQVRNNGPGAAGRFKIAYYLSTDTTITTSDMLLTTYEFLMNETGDRRYLQAGETFLFGFTLHLAVPDALRTTNQYTLGYIIDPANDVLETNELNNSNQGLGVDRGVVSSEAGLASPANGSAVTTALYRDNPRAGAIGDEWIGGFDLDAYSFTAAAGEWLGVTVAKTSGALDPYVRLYDASWNLLAGNDESGRSDFAAGDCYLPYHYTASGTYYLVVGSVNNAMANPRSFAGRVGGSTGGYSVLVSAAQCDLVGSAFEVIAPDVGSDHKALVRYTVANQGFAPSGTYAVVLYASEDAAVGAGDSILYGVDAQGALQPGQSRTVTVEVDLNNTSDPWRTDNEYWLGTAVITGDELTSTNNSNRGAGLDKAAISSEATAARPAAAKSVRATPVAIGQSLAGVIGDEWIGPYDIDVYSIDLAAGQIVCLDLDRTSGTLNTHLRLYTSSWALAAQNDNGAAPGESLGTDSYLEYTPSKSGTYYIVAASSANPSALPYALTGRAAGTTGAYLLTTSAKAPDLTGVGFFPDAALPAAAGGRCRVAFSVANVGYEAAKEFLVDFYLSDDSEIDGHDVLVGQTLIDGVAAGAVFDGVISLRLPTSDPFGDNQYWVGMVIDSERAAVELDEDNNAGQGDGLDRYAVWNETDLPRPMDEVSVQARIMSLNGSAAGTIGDEWVASLDLDTYAFYAQAGQSLCFQVDSPDERLDPMIRIFDDRWELIDSNDNGAPPGQEAGRNSYLELKFKEDAVYFAVIGGSGNEGSPTSLHGRERASTGSYAFWLYEPRPDLTAGSVGYTAGTHEPGAALRVTGSEINSGILGVEAGEAFALQARLSSDAVWGNADDVVLGSITESAGLASSGSRAFSIPGTIPAGTLNGDYYLAVRIDSGGAIDESAEDNNTWWSSAADVAVRYTGIIEVPIDATHPVVFTEPTGDVTTVTLKGAGAGVVAYNRDLKARIERVELNALTTAATTLTFSTRRGAVGDGEVDVVDILLHGPVSSVKGPVNLLGGLQADSTLATLTLDDVTAARGIAIAGAGVPVSVTFDQVADTSLLSASPVKSLKAGSWRNTDGSADTISAPLLGTITVAGECGASLVATGADVKGVAVSSVKVGRGAGLSLTALAGGVGSLQVKLGDWAGGGLSCLRCGAVSVAGGLFDNDWTVVQTLAGLTVKGAAADTAIRTGGAVGAVKLGAADGFDLLAGTDAGSARHAQDATELGAASIKSFTVSGLGAGSTFADSNVSAAALGACTITNVAYDNRIGGVHTAFGFWCVTIPSLKVVDTTAPRDKTRNFTWKPGASAPSPDLTVQLF